MMPRIHRNLDSKNKIHAWLVTGWLLVLMVINWGDKAVVGLAAEPITKELGLTPTQFGLVGSSLFLLFGIAQLPAGLISDRISSRWMIGSLAIMWSFAQLPILLLGTLPMLFLSRIVLGAAEGPAAPVVTHTLSNWFPPHKRAVPVAIATAGTGIGLAITAPLLTFIIVNHGWRSSLVVLAVAGVLWTAVWLMIGRDGPYALPTGRSRTPASEVGGQKIAYRKILGTRTFIGALVCSHFGYWALAASTAWLPSYLAQIRHYSKPHVGSLMVLPAVVSAIAMVLAAIVATAMVRKGATLRTSYGRLQCGAVAIGGLCLLALPLAPAGLPLYILIAIGFGLPTASFPLGALTVSAISPQSQRGTVLCCLNALMTTGGVITPFLIGLLIQNSSTPALGHNAAWLAIGLFMVAAALVGQRMINPERDATRLGLGATSSAERPALAT